MVKEEINNGWRAHMGSEQTPIAAPTEPEVCTGLLHLHTPYQGDNSQHTLRKEAASTQTKSRPLIPDKLVE